ncbi:MAG: long-chain fatty acid--CoA ligase [Acidobacteriota bacterium]
MAFDTLCTLFLHAVGNYRKENALMYKKGDRYVGISSEEFERRVKLFMYGLCALGVEKEDKVALLSENRPEWAICDFGILCAGSVNVPIYTTLPADQIKYILADSDTTVQIVSNELQLNKIRLLRDELPKLKRIIALEPVKDAGDVLTYDQVLELGEKKQKEDPDLFRRRVDAVKPNDLASLIYTSGTTGTPKGVMLMHSNLVSNVKSTSELIPLYPEDVALSFLPLSHILERMVDYLLMSKGVTLAYAESIEKVPVNLVEVHPTTMTSVPRLYEKMYARVMDMAKSGSPLKQKIFFWALEVGRRYSQAVLRKESPPAMLSLQKSLATKLVFHKIQARTGGRLRFCISGGAPLAREIAEFFHAAGIVILEGYGLTETSPVIAVNTFKDVKLGSVGKVVPDVEVKIAEDGEILCKGPNVMKGYYKKEAETKEAMADGWFRTGDIGHIDRDGFLVITDRKKDLLKTSGGKYVAPQPIENTLKTHEMIASVIVLGDKRKFCCALIVPTFEKLEAWAGAKGIAFRDRDELVRNKQVLDYMLAEVNRMTPHLAQFERIKKIALLPRDFTIEDGEITPTMKVKRAAVDKKYRDVIDRLYAEGEAE